MSDAAGPRRHIWRQTGPAGARCSPQSLCRTLLCPYYPVSSLWLARAHTSSPLIGWLSVSISTVQQWSRVTFVLLCWHAPWRAGGWWHVLCVSWKYTDGGKQHQSIQIMINIRPLFCLIIDTCVRKLWMKYSLLSDTLNITAADLSFSGDIF